MPTILGAPVIGSNPHFYDAYQGYIDGVEGMKPNKTLHLTYLILEAVRNYKQNKKKNKITMLRSHLIFPMNYREPTYY